MEKRGPVAQLALHFRLECARASRLTVVECLGAWELTVETTYGNRQ